MTAFKPDETMLHNYLQNKLSPTEEEQLELWLADHPEALEELELDLVMMAGVEIEQQHLNESIPMDISKSNIRSSWVIGLLLVTVIGLIYERLNVYDVPVKSVMVESAPLQLGQNRSDQIQNYYEIDPKGTLIRVNVPPLGLEKFNVVLLHNGKTVFELNGLTQIGGELTIMLRAGMLKKGLHQLEVKHQNAADDQKQVYDLMIKG